jgi:serine/threonine-protein kinase
MAKVFTITEGLENMGALRTGGQGSVYKGKRIGEIIVAVKLLPTPILHESEDDKNFRDFRNEVEKLKKVNEKPNPNVVKILNSGITDSGSFPFIEMEFIEGPDLEELLKEPHDSVFTIPEVIKVAGQLANALSHCHKLSIKHGDIKSNNVKFNLNTGNYILLDFGMAIMSDEQRRTSLRHAGAVEFMAPEQNEGLMLFQSDVYGFGIIMYEILAGRVPFPLHDNGQTARNTVMVSHMEMPLPDALELRKQNLPGTWPDTKKEREMQVPQWLLSLITKCLEKNPENRFANGMELQEAVLHTGSQSSPVILESPPALQSELNRLQTALSQEEEKSKTREQELLALKQTVTKKEQEILALQSGGNTNPEQLTQSVSLSKPLFFALLLVLLASVGFAGYSLLGKKQDASASVPSQTENTSFTDSAQATVNITPKPISKKEERQRKEDSVLNVLKDSINSENVITPEPAPETSGSTEEIPNTSTDEPGDDHIGKIFTLIVTESYFHTKPDASTRRNAFINHWNKARLTALDDKNGFIYVSYKNDDGVVTKGWLNKKDLVIIGE